MCQAIISYRLTRMSKFGIFDKVNCSILFLAMNRIFWTVRSINREIHLLPVDRKGSQSYGIQIISEKYKLRRN